jgi:hypothetical protein
MNQAFNYQRNEKEANFLRSRIKITGFFQAKRILFLLDFIRIQE